MNTAPRIPLFDGVTYEPQRDHARLSSQFLAVRDLMLDGKPRTLREIAAVVGAPEASVSARLRDMRKARFGGYEVERHYSGEGLFAYSVRRSESAQQILPGTN